MSLFVSDLQAMDLVEFDLSSRQMDQAMAWRLLGPAYTIWLGKPIAVFGLVADDTVSTAWGYVNKRAKEHPIAFTRVVRRLLLRAADSAGVNRLQCMVDAEDDACVRFARIMGFEDWYTVPDMMAGHDMKGMQQWLGLSRS